VRFADKPIKLEGVEIMVIKKKVTKVRELAAAVAAGVLFTAFNAQAGSLPGPGIIDYQFDCPTATCVDLKSGGYEVSGGAVLFDTVPNRALKPGSDTAGYDTDRTTSFNVTSSSNEPEGAGTAISVTGLDNMFGLFWGSVDSGNRIDFYSDGERVAEIWGSDLVTRLTALEGNSDFLNGTGSNFGFDVYLNFTGIQGRDGIFGQFDEVRLSSSNIAFEVATAAVPVPGMLGLLGLGLLGIGAAGRWRKR